MPCGVVVSLSLWLAAQSIAGQSKLIVGARLARSGQPIAEAGDSQSAELVTLVEANLEDALLVELIINQRK